MIDGIWWYKKPAPLAILTKRTWFLKDYDLAGDLFGEPDLEMLSGRAQEICQETTWDEVSGGFFCENSEIWIWKPLMSDSGVRFHQLVGGFKHREAMVAQERCMEAIGSLEHIIRYVYIYIFWLVVWNILYFSIIYGIILPIDFHIFQRGWNHQPAKNAGRWMGTVFFFIVFGGHWPHSTVGTFMGRRWDGMA